MFTKPKSFLPICGAMPLETYSVHDAYKGDMNLEDELLRFEDILKRNFMNQ
jgi:modulator of drug activity B